MTRETPPAQYLQMPCVRCQGRHIMPNGRLCDHSSCGGTGFVLVNMRPDPTAAGLDRLVNDVLDDHI